MASLGLGLPPPRQRAQPAEWKSPEGHTLFRLPPSVAVPSASPVNAPLYLDPAIIPSFPPNFAGIGSGRASLAETLSIGGSSLGDPKASKGHSRTWSGSPASLQREPAPPANYLIVDAKSYNLETRRLQNMLRSLKSLIPSERMPPGGDSSTECLPGSMLLVPGGMLLEAILLERDCAGAGKIRSLPPVLDNGASLYPSFDSGIDWVNMAGYAETFGLLLDTFVPVLKRPTFSSTGATSVEAEVLRNLQKQIGKLKRTLGDVVTSYVDRFSFLSGLWDESHLVKTVEEVARWGKLVA